MACRLLGAQVSADQTSRLSRHQVTQSSCECGPPEVPARRPKALVASANSRHLDAGLGVRHQALIIGQQ